MHALNRISSDDHYYLNPNEQKKATEMLMRASVQGELDYALGRLVQWGARQIGRTVSEDQKRRIDEVTKGVLPTIGKAVATATGQPIFGTLGSSLAEAYDYIEPSYDYAKGKYTEFRNRNRKQLPPGSNGELDYETAEKIVKAVDQTLNTIKRNNSIRSSKQAQALLGQSLAHHLKSTPKGRWYRLKNGDVVLKGAAQ